MLNWRRGVSLPWVYVHYAIYETSLVEWFSRDLCLIGGGGGVSLPWCSGFPEIYAQLEEGQSAMGICAFCYI